MLQQDDRMISLMASGESHTVREFCELAFSEAGLDYRDYVKQGERFYRLAEVESWSVTPARPERSSNGRPITAFQSW